MPDRLTAVYPQIIADKEGVSTLPRLKFSRKQAVTLSVIDLNEAIKGNGSFLRRLISEDIELMINCTEEPLTVLVDRSHAEKNGKLGGDENNAPRHLPVVFVSGYTRDIFAQNNVFDENSAFIQKPVPPVVLLVRVRELLDKSTATGGGS